MKSRQKLAATVVGLRLVVGLRADVSPKAMHNVVLSSSSSFMDPIWGGGVRLR